MAEHHVHCCEAPAAVPGDTRFRRALWFVLVLNASMFVIEMTSGLAAGSVALQADALDFLGDSASYIISLVVLGMAMRARTAAAMIKGIAMTGFGLWVVGVTVWHLLRGGVPDFAVMGAIGSLALVVNVVSAIVLFRFKGGDANMRSVWLCSRNDAIGNIAVVLAASGVFATQTKWPDLAVAAVMASLALYAGIQVIRHAAAEWRAGDPPLEAREGSG